MAIPFPTDEWIEEWEQELRNNETYQEASEGWGVEFNGNFVFHLEADDRLPEDMYYFIGLEDGDVFDCREVPDPEDTDYGFIYRGAYADWVRLTEGEVGAIDGLMSGVFELDGDMQKVLQYSDAAVSMVETASTIETDYEY
jgi:putative sterol carrier protein